MLRSALRWAPYLSALVVFAPVILRNGWAGLIVLCIICFLLKPGE